MLLMFVVDMLCFIWNSDTSLLLFLKGHVGKPDNVDGMF